MKLLLALVFATTAPSLYTIRADRFVGPLAVGRATVPQARAAYGDPATVKRTGEVCKAVWPDRGLSMQFLDFAANPCKTGGIVFATMVGRAWHTSAGLRIGDPMARVGALYPHASYHRGDGWWLVTRRTCTEVGGSRYPALLARTLRGHVSAFVVSAGVCD